MYRFIVLPIISLLLVIFSGCDSKPPVQLTVLAGSELKDLQPFFQKIRKETGIELQMEYIGTLDGAEKLASGAVYDMAWFSHGKYLSMIPETKGRIHAQEKIMLSPVVLGIKQNKAKQWGWLDSQKIRWSDIAEKAASGELRYAMTNPASSNSGFTSLLGVAAAFSSGKSAITSSDVDKDKLKQFFTGQKLTSGSSGWLAEAYVREQNKLDGLINYESVLMSLNTSGELREKLHLIYPTEGIVTADYPLMLLNSSQRESFKSLVTYLKSEEFQQLIMEKTNRRPVIPQIRPSGNFSRAMLVELPFPADRATVDSLIFSYLDEVRPPSSPLFLLDVSGSMKDQRIKNLRLALKNLTGLDNTLTGKFSRFRVREQVVLLPFNHKPYRPTVINVNSGESDSPDMEFIRQFVDNLQANGGTAIYATLIEAYKIAGEQKQKYPNRFYSIVLLSDGKNEHAIGYADFEQFYKSQPPATKDIKTFTILFGNAHKEEMHQVADLTGGRVFDGQSKSLASVFKKIRGYQ